MTDLKKAKKPAVPVETWHDMPENTPIETARKCLAWIRDDRSDSVSEGENYAKLYEAFKVMVRELEDDFDEGSPVSPADRGVLMDKLHPEGRPVTPVEVVREFFADETKHDSQCDLRFSWGPCDCGIAAAREAFEEVAAHGRLGDWLYFRTGHRP